MNEPVVKAYFQYMIDVAVQLGAEENATNAELQKVLEFEMKLANISMPKTDISNTTKIYNPATLAELPISGGLPNSWTIYFRKLFDFGDEKLDIQESEKVIVMDTNFYKNVGSVLQSTDKRTLANYIGWRIAHETIENLGPKARDISQKFLKAKSGVDQKLPQWKICLGKLSSGYGRVVDSMYARFIFNVDSKKQVLDMTHYLRLSFAKILDDVKWMDNETKNEARKKLTHLKEHMAYPDELLDSEKVDGLYSVVDPDKEGYFEHTLTLNKHITQYSDLRLREVVDPEDWRDWVTVAKLGAFYIPFTNSIEFSAGMLQGIILSSLQYDLIKNKY